MQEAKAEMKDFREDALASLPGYFKKLTAPYEYRVYYFEIFECIRKLLLLGLPILFEKGSMPQLVIGILVCFTSFGAYMMLAPYVKDSDDHLSQLCQFQVFFSLLAALIMKNPGEPETKEIMGYILAFMLAMPPVVAVVANNPLTTKVLCRRDRRKKLFGFIGDKIVGPIVWRFKYGKPNKDGPQHKEMTNLSSIQVQDGKGGKSSPSALLSA